MTAPDLELARRFLDAHGPPDAVLHVGVTGAHIYGFASKDSDIDLKGMHVASTAKLLSLTPDSPAHDRLVVFEGVECDLTTHEVAPALRRLLAGDGNVLERILSPFQLVDGTAFRDLQRIARAGIHSGYLRHYAGYLRGMQREHGLKRRSKTALYTYRVALTGTHLLRTGELVTDVAPLAEKHRYPVVAELIAAKVAGKEKDGIPSELEPAVRDDWVRLERELQEAGETSALPVEAQNRAEVEAWLLELRRSQL